MYMKYYISNMYSKNKKYILKTFYQQRELEEPHNQISTGKKESKTKTREPDLTKINSLSWKENYCQQKSGFCT